MSNAEELLRQAAQQCDAQGDAQRDHATVEAQRARLAGNAARKALAYLAGERDAEILAQRDRSTANIAAFELLQRVTGQRGMVFLPNRDYPQELRDYCARQGIVAPVLPEKGAYEQ